VKNIEMHLVSREAQTVVIDGQSFDFSAGESIHTETSRKYTMPAVSTIVEAPDGTSMTCGPTRANRSVCLA
jgi:uncharacterized SAM-dependent methyltransferase